MDSRAITGAAVIWFLGVLVPVLHHSLLMLAAVQEEAHSYSFINMVRDFWRLPWLIWAYVLGMFLLGLWLVLRSTRQGKAAD
ncbi:MAG: hypothetical protein EHM35_15030 [Planctomycetaceae bacterium]|nr:MAG: hypothetical protein EHM35_15030 [Planctomycetaceae bacterium]